jgi:hypothetical protein
MQSIYYKRHSPCDSDEEQKEKGLRRFVQREHDSVLGVIRIDPTQFLTDPVPQDRKDRKTWIDTLRTRRWSEAQSDSTPAPGVNGRL